MTHRKWLTRRQVADEYAVSIRTVYRWTENGTLRAYRVGGSTRYKASDVDLLARPLETAATR